MRGLTSKDGKMSGNVQMIGSYDKSKGHKPPAEHHDGGGMDQPMHEVVAAHGPAKQHLITKHEDGHHSSHTMHEDGHKHGPVHHDSLEEAHEHGQQAMGDAEHTEMGDESGDRAQERHENEMSGGKSLDFMSE